MQNKTFYDKSIVLNIITGTTQVYGKSNEARDDGIRI